jgi:hypothetical protein
LVKLDIYHPPLSSDVFLHRVNSNLNCEFSYQNFAPGNYTLLYNILSTCDWTGVYGTSVDVGVASLSAAVRDAMEQEIPRGCNPISKFPPWFSDALRYYIFKKNYYYRRLERNHRIFSMINRLIPKSC